MSDSVSSPVSDSVSEAVAPEEKPAKAPPKPKTYLPKLLSFERSISVGQGLLWGGRSDTPDFRVPIEVGRFKAKGVIGPMNAETARPSYDDVKKAETGTSKNAHLPNPQSGDDAMLPHGCDRLILTTHAVFGKHMDAPCAVSLGDDFLKYFTPMINAYLTPGGGIEALAWRYTYRLLDGSMLWRNLQTAHSARVKITDTLAKTTLYDGPTLAKSAQLTEPLFATIQQHAPQVYAAVLAALSGQGPSFHADIEYSVGYMPGLRVYPSQLIKVDKDDDGQEVRRVLLWVKTPHAQKHAAITAQKLANSVRRIDGWHNFLGIADLPFEPFGQNLAEMRAYRIDSKPTDASPSFYALLKAFVKGYTLTPDQQHYFVGVLIRGGVFSESD